MSKEAAAREITQRYLEVLVGELGTEIGAALQDPEITEVLYDNGAGTVWVDHRRRGLEILRVERAFTAERAAALLQTIAALLRKPLDEEHPEIEGDLPFLGHRVHGILPPVSVNGPTWSLRKHTSAAYPLAAFCGRDTAVVGTLLARALTERSNILLVGGTGSGKTSFLNRLLLMATALAGDPPERHVICEDTMELRSASRATARLQTSATHDLAALVRSCLRLRPDRIVIGEVRGPEALAALKSWNTGTPGGLFTVHANSAREGLERLEQLSLEASLGPQHGLIGQTVDLVIHLARLGSGKRRVLEMVQVAGNLGGAGRYDVVPLYQRKAGMQ